MPIRNVAPYLAFALCSLQGLAQQESRTPVPETRKPAALPDSTTENSVTISGHKVAYRAVAGTITVGATDAADATLAPDGQLLPDVVANPTDPAKPEDAPPTARMFYAAYFKKDGTGVDAGPRPVMFFFNGGPGSATLWLHMGSFGPRRVMTPDTDHPAGAPYMLVDNKYSLLDVTDMVFIDAPGTGFSSIQGKEKEKAFWGIDGDAHAFERFIRKFLTKYDRWNSPKYIFGESYGTPRAAVLSGLLQNVDLNGIVLLSAILSYSNSPDSPRWNPGIDEPYALVLPSFAATAFYHHKLPTQPPALVPFLHEVEAFATGEYFQALLAGATLPDEKRVAIAAKLHSYTGLAAEFWLKADLRVSGPAFSKALQDNDGLTTGRLDSRFKGPDMYRLGGEADYDPMFPAFSAAYVTAINQYLRTELRYGKDQTYKATIWGDPSFTWDSHHQPPGGPPANSVNTLPDLAYAMKMNPKMGVLLAGGYFDLGTPYFEGVFEMRHLPVPSALQRNIVYKYFESGHMVYVNESVLQQLREDLVAFLCPVK